MSTRPLTVFVRVSRRRGQVEIRIGASRSRSERVLIAAPWDLSPEEWGGCLAGLDLSAGWRGLVAPEALGRLLAQKLGPGTKLEVDAH